jgi:hypothetical protein
MKIIQISIFAVLKRFPDHKEIIKRLFSEDNSFKSVLPLPAPSEPPGQPLTVSFVSLSYLMVFL